MNKNLEKCDNFKVYYSTIKESYVKLYKEGTVYPKRLDSIAYTIIVNNNTSEKIQYYFSVPYDCKTKGKMLFSDYSIKKLKHIFFSAKANDKLMILNNGDYVSNTLPLDKESDHCYIEWFNNQFYTTDHKGNRQPIQKVGKFLKLVFPNFNDTEISDKVDYLKRLGNGIYTDDIVIEDDISMVYNSCHIDRGTVGGSCMIDNGYMYDAFTRSSNCKIAVLWDSGNVKGRALVWDNVRTNKLEEPITFMDRIYYDNEETRISFEKFALKQGWYRRTHQNYELDCATDVTTPTNKTMYLDMVVDIGRSTEDSELPYMDTFASTNDCGRFYNHNECSRELRGTEGNLDDRECCEYCGDRTHDDDLYSTYSYGYVCEYCANNYYVWCEDIQDRVHAEREDCFYCEDTGEYVHDRDNCHYTDDDYYIRYIDNAISTEDGYLVYDESNCYYCEEDYTYWWDEDLRNEREAELRAEREQEDEDN